MTGAKPKPLEKYVLTIEEFCLRNSMTIVLYRRLRRDGFGPKEMLLGPNTVRISVEEEYEWRKARTSPGGKEAEQIAAARAARIEAKRQAGMKSAASPNHINNRRKAAEER